VADLIEAETIILLGKVDGSPWPEAAQEISP